MSILMDILNMLNPFTSSGNSQNFSDGSSISFVSKEEFLFKTRDGRSVLVYAFISGTPSEFERVIVMDSIKYWTDTNKQTAITENEQSEILARFAEYKGFRGIKVGFGWNKDKNPVDLLDIRRKVGVKS
jgi:hypothetical protein